MFDGKFYYVATDVSNGSSTIISSDYQLSFGSTVYVDTPTGIRQFSITAVYTNTDSWPSLLGKRAMPIVSDTDRARTASARASARDKVKRELDRLMDAYLEQERYRKAAEKDPEIAALYEEYLDLA